MPKEDEMPFLSPKLYGALTAAIFISRVCKVSICHGRDLPNAYNSLSPTLQPTMDHYGLHLSLIIVYFCISFIHLFYLPSISLVFLSRDSVSSRVSTRNVTYSGEYFESSQRHFLTLVLLSFLPPVTCPYFI